MINIIILIAVLFNAFFGTTKFFTEPSNFNVMQSAGLRTKEKQLKNEGRSRSRTEGQSKPKQIRNERIQVPIGIQKALVNLNLSIKELITHSGQCISPPVFTGSLNQELQDVNEFITWYKHVATVNNWDDEKLVQYLCIALEGDAKKWYSAQILKGTVHTWPEWEALLRSAFRTPHFEEIMQIQLGQRTQTSVETVQNYFHDVIYLCAKVNPDMSEADKLRHLLRGLQPDFMGKIMIMRPTDTADFFEKIQEILRGNLMMKNNVDRTNKASMSKATSLAVQDVTLPTPVAPLGIPEQPALFQELKTMPVIYRQMTTTVECIEKILETAMSQPVLSNNDETTPRVKYCSFCHLKGHLERSCRFARRQRSIALQGSQPQDSKDDFHASSVHEHEPFPFLEMNIYELF